MCKQILLKTPLHLNVNDLHWEVKIMEEPTQPINSLSQHLFFCYSGVAKCTSYKEKNWENCLWPQQHSLVQTGGVIGLHVEGNAKQSNESLLQVHQCDV
jgi:hypothetical protein